MLDEFRKFIARGSFFDLAVGIAVGAAFSTVVNSLVKDILMPPIGLLTSGVDFSELYLNLSDGEFASLAEATQAGAATINYGIFINNVISFLVVAVVLFLLIRQYNRIQDRYRREPAPGAPTEKTCPRCRMTVPVDATRCPHCTSDLSTE
ncbi:MAG: large conductance mechanosensitive channel protein MscL [Candidatus Palauibacterales bacterium]|nr:large conductance mechanosensitive channel protein MscL [Candidatus Palauibacterales bacterium]